MKAIFTTLCVLLSVCSGFAQKFPVDTLYKTGALNNRVNIVILGDGFTEAEMPTFRAEAKKFADFFLSYSPYDHYKNYFNFFSISTPSKDSGITNPGTAPDAYPDQPVNQKDTYYKGTFGTGIHRLVTIDFGIAFNVLSSNFPEYDLAVVLANTKFYGGSGGSIAVHTLHEQADLIGVHEIGHTFSSLNDEYWAGPQYGWEAPNMTANSNPMTIKWRNWLNSSGIGIHKHGTDSVSSKWYKPTDLACLMELLNQQFCAVCREATVERILSVVNPVEKLEPDAEGIVNVGAEKTFKLNLVRPEPNTLKVNWLLNDKSLAENVDEVKISGDSIDIYAKLTATVFDTTQISRSDNAENVRFWKYEWNLESTSPKIFRVSQSADSVCLGEIVTFTAAGCPGAISWSTGETGNSISVRPSTTMQISATCKVTGSPDSTITKSVVSLPLPVATASNTGPYFEGSTIELSAKGGDTYSWTGPSNFSSNLQTVLISNAQVVNAGIYEVVATNTYGCQAKANTEVVVDPILGVGQEPVDWLQVSPNPAREFVKVSTKLSGASTFTLFDAAGRKLLVKPFETETAIRVNFAAGMYYYRFKNGDKETSGKLLVQ
ncbi:M64 family metallopeptidase [Dyadobacter luticola]|uniref:T9SS type A sorting domain-containing protein n=1 Tax=Dyadobacter luticola TaxID=1979387 RepID=A0A5R9L3H3_9BACT|nr:M64 family metallopeptidase [Dyadobacter luticola]TLV03093.1 T9SS type A sorting domain-containing protein [Dyadobacter luticola]